MTVGKVLAFGARRSRNYAPPCTGYTAPRRLFGNPQMHDFEWPWIR